MQTEIIDYNPPKIDYVITRLGEEVIKKAKQYNSLQDSAKAKTSKILEITLNLFNE
jgi:DNA-binding HxlR family transcriptional regulator